MKSAVSILLAGALIVPLAACKSSEQASSGCVACVTAKAKDGWCEGCGVGFKDGAKMKCKSCHVAATGKGGWCEGCGKGYAAGKPTTCKGCATAAVSGGTCASCVKK